MTFGTSFGPPPAPGQQGNGDTTRAPLMRLGGIYPDRNGKSLGGSIRLNVPRRGSPMPFGHEIIQLIQTAMAQNLDLRLIVFEDNGRFGDKAAPYTAHFTLDRPRPQQPQGFAAPQQYPQPGPPQQYPAPVSPQPPYPQPQPQPYPQQVWTQPPQQQPVVQYQPQSQPLPRLAQGPYPQQVTQESYEHDDPDQEPDEQVPPPTAPAAQAPRPPRRQPRPQ